MQAQARLVIKEGSDDLRPLKVEDSAVFLAPPGYR